jgi:hypothetical protein
MLFISNESAARWAESNFPRLVENDARQNSLLYWLSNLAFSAYNSYRGGVIEVDVFDTHLHAVILYWPHDRISMIPFMRKGEFTEHFVEELAKRLEKFRASGALPASVKPAVTL